MKRTKPYALILFDLDGTLTDPKLGITRSVRYALDHMGVATPDLDALTRFIGPPLHLAFSRLYGFDEAQALAAVAFYREYFEETGLYENVVYPGIPRLLERLRALDRRLIVATSKPTVYARRILDHFSLTPYFASVEGSALNLTRTDKAQIIAEIVSAHPDVGREAMVMIGDRVHDITGARANHLDSIGVTYGYGSRTELRDAGVTALAASVDELAALLDAWE